MTIIIIRMISAITNAKIIAQASIKSLLNDVQSISSLTFTLEETYSDDVKALPDRITVDIKNNGSQIVSFVNSLAHENTQLVTVLVNSPNVMVCKCNYTSTIHCCHNNRH